MRGTNQLLNSVTKQDVRDQLANCMLLSQDENGAGGTSDILPEIWFSEKPESIPQYAHNSALYPLHLVLKMNRLVFFCFYLR